MKKVPTPLQFIADHDPPKLTQSQEEYLTGRFQFYQLESEMSEIAKDQVGGTHYKQFPIQPIEYAEDNELTPMEFSAIKYITRHREKGKLDDLKKAAHYLKMMMAHYYGEEMHISYREKRYEEPRKPPSPSMVDDREL